MKRCPVESLNLTGMQFATVHELLLQGFPRIPPGPQQREKVGTCSWSPIEQSPSGPVWSHEGSEAWLGISCSLVVEEDVLVVSVSLLAFLGMLKLLLFRNSHH